MLQSNQQDNTEEPEIYYEIDEAETKDNKKIKIGKSIKRLSIAEEKSDLNETIKKKPNDDNDYILPPQKRELSNLSDIKVETDKELKEELNLVKLGSFKEDIPLQLTNLNLPSIKKAKGYSKYDYVKVKVTLEEHFYVLSRFLVSRMLTLCRVKII